MVYRLWLAFAVGVAALLAGPDRASAEWIEAKTRHFIIYADQDPEELRAFATKLEKFDQAARMVRVMDDPELTDSNKLVVYVLRDMDAVGKLAGSSMVAGFYIGRASGSVAFVPEVHARRKKVVGQLDPQTVFFHEYAHHLHLQNTAAAMPGWLVEGFAEFFSTAMIEKDGSVVIGAAANHRAWALFNLKNLTLEEMLGGTYRKLDMFETEQLYGRGWLLAHYLTFEPSRRGQLLRYMQAIQGGQTALASAQSSFGDIRELDRDLNRYLRNRTIKTLIVPADRLTVGDIALRPLSRGEIAILPVKMRSARGVTAKTARDVASDARKIAAAHPNDPTVQTALAEAELDASNHAAAEQAADRALAATPNHGPAIILKGRARMELAARDPKTADWKAIRALFARANRLDPNNAEPLMLFYESFLREGVYPTRNSITGLLYAADVVPQDDNLRLMAVRQLLDDKDLAKARILFAPLAFNPHASDKWRDAAAIVVAAIAEGKAERAAALLDAATAPEDGKNSGEKSRR